MADVIKMVVKLGLLVLVGVAVATYVVVSKHATKPHWVTAEAHIVGTTLGVESDGWTYAVGGSVPLWFDRHGNVHDSSWPECLKPGTRTVKFAWLKADVLGTAVRPIVAVDCRG